MSHDDSDELAFAFVPKRQRKEAAQADDGTVRKGKKTAYEIERDAKAAAALAEWEATARPHTPPPPTQESYTPDGTDPRAWARPEDSGPVDRETRARINRSRNHNLMYNALMEVDPSTKRTMQMSLTPGTSASGGVPQFRSTNRLAGPSSSPGQRGGRPGQGYERGFARGMGGVGGRGRGGIGYQTHASHQQRRGGTFSDRPRDPKRPRE